MDNLKALANALTEALYQHLGKPIFPGTRKTAVCHSPKAWVHWDGIDVNLHPDQPADTLTYEEAKRYLAWLRAGNFGHHWYVENAFLNGGTQ